MMICKNDSPDQQVTVPMMTQLLPPLLNDGKRINEYPYDDILSSYGYEKSIISTYVMY
jgi:hypothetical protein